jgi:signal recognition particle receptor subunit beta
MAHTKFIFAGPPGVGKSTAIAAISDKPPIMTDVAATDEVAAIKAMTTVAMDYGEFDVGDGSVVRLYGTPGQKRFDFMWRILLKGALGLIVLIDNSRDDPLADLCNYLDDFGDFAGADGSGVVIGITRLGERPAPSLDDYTELLMNDMRKRDDVLMLMDALLVSLEYAA